MVGFVKPHHPFDPPAPWDEMYDPGSLEILPGWTPQTPPDDRAYHGGYFPNHELTEAALRRVMAYYYATISQIDHHVERLVETLNARGLYENTLIVFASDHGDYVGYHHMILKSGPMYEPLVRVPLLVKFPGNAAGGEKRDALTSLIDVAPTLLRQAGLEPPAGMSGLDLADPSAQRPMVIAENRRGTVLMARSPARKLILSRTPEHCRFFDLQTDPWELTDRFGDNSYREVIQQHREALADWAMFEALPPACIDESAPTIRQANVPDPDDGHREEMRAYSERKVAEYLRG
jgi:arylsulfatase A-like enzyme